MRFAIVLNGCSCSLSDQIEQISEFLRAHLVGGGPAAQGHAIIFHCGETELEEEINLVPTDYVTLIKISRYQPETILDILMEHLSGGVELLIFPGDFAGRELSVRLGYRRGGTSLVGVTKIEIEEDALYCTKSVYSNHMTAGIRLHGAPYCISIARGRGKKKAVIEKSHPEVIRLDKSSAESDNFVIDSECILDKESAGLQDAALLLIAGRGTGNKSKLKKLEQIARHLGAELGVTRPVAMAGWAPIKHLVGVSGAMTRAELCIVAGASGAGPFYAGIEKCAFIVAINCDGGAPIMKNSDIVIVDDYEDVLEELIKITAGA